MTFGRRDSNAASLPSSTLRETSCGWKDELRRKTQRCGTQPALPRSKLDRGEACPTEVDHIRRGWTRGSDSKPYVSEAC